MSSKTYLGLATAGIALLTAGAIVSAPVHAKTIEKREAEAKANIPVCTHKLGTLAVKEPDTNWWQQLGLGSPEALIKVFVQRSQCFTLVDRGKGLQAAEQERALSGSGQLRKGSNVGMGQIKAADYVLIPDLVNENAHAGGGGLGGLGAWLPGAAGIAGAVIGGINVKKKTADVVLTVTDVRTLEQRAMVEGHAKKTDLGWGAGGGVFTGGWLAGGGAYGYNDTEIGQVVTLAYLDAYTQLVQQFGGLPESASEEAGGQAVVMTKPGIMYKNANQKGGKVRDLDPGMMLYPTGNKEDPMWEVEDELGHKGWVSSLLFQLGR
jgi:curli biogenesis system outer membrane secretion channel CsgG